MNKVIEMPEGKLDILEMPPKPLLYPHAEPHHTTSQMVKVILMRSHEDIDVRGVYLFGRSKPIDISDHVNFQLQQYMCNLTSLDTSANYDFLTTLKVSAL